MSLKERKTKYFQLCLKWRTVANTGGKLNISNWRWEETAHAKYPRIPKKLQSIKKTKRRWGFFFVFIDQRASMSYRIWVQIQEQERTNPPTAAELWCIPQEQQWNPPAPSPPSHPKGHPCPPQARFTRSSKHNIEYHSAAQIRTGLFSSATKGFCTF